MKKVVEGYIARAGNGLIFSDKPMKQGGFIGDGDIWYGTIETEERSPLDFRADMHPYIDIPELTHDDSPRRCTITIEVGGFVGERIDAGEMERRYRIRRCVTTLAEETGKTLEEAVEILSRSIPDIKKYMED